MGSCTKTITEPGTTDTLRDTLHSVDTLHTLDTLHDTLGSGQAWVRFVSMYPDPLRLSTAQGTLFTIAFNTCQGQYIPLRADSSYTFYLTDAGNPGWSDSLPIGILGNAIYTIALFPLGANNADWDQPIIDSEKLTPPPPGYCYLRFIDGNGDQQFFIDLDSAGNSLFKANGHSVSFSYKSLTPYVLIKANTSHTIFLRDPSTGQTPVRNQEYFVDGFYYTGRIIGSLKNNTAQIAFDQE